MPEKCLYSLLGLASNATRAQIKAQFYKLSKLYHPDLSSTDSDTAWRKEKFNEISQAYQILSDDRLRRDYDIQYGHLRLQLERSTGIGRSYRPASRYHAPSTGPFQWNPHGSQHEHASPGIQEELQRRWERVNRRHKPSAQNLSEDEARLRQKEDYTLFRNRLLVVGTGVLFYLALEMTGNR